MQSLGVPPRKFYGLYKVKTVRNSFYAVKPMYSSFKSLTLRLLELLDQKLIRILGLCHNQLLEKVFHKFKDLLLLEV